MLVDLASRYSGEHRGFGRGPSEPPAKYPDHPIDKERKWIGEPPHRIAAEQWRATSTYVTKKMAAQA